MLQGLLAITIFLSVVIDGLVYFWMGWGALIWALFGAFTILALVGALLLFLLRCLCCCFFTSNLDESRNSQEASNLEAPRPSLQDDDVTRDRAVANPTRVELMKSDIGWFKHDETAKQERNFGWEPANEFNPFSLSYTSELQAADTQAPRHVACSERAAADVTHQSVTVFTGQSGLQLHPDLQAPPVICFKTKEGKKARKRDPFCQGLLIATYVVTLPVLVYLMISAAARGAGRGQVLYYQHQGRATGAGASARPRTRYVYAIS